MNSIITPTTFIPYLHQILFIFFSYFQMSYPSIYEISGILLNEDICVQFLKEKGVFYKEWTCIKCNRPMKYYDKRYRFRCPVKECSKEISLRKHSFFQGHRLPIHKILHLGYLQWLPKPFECLCKIWWKIINISVNTKAIIMRL